MDERLEAIILDCQELRSKHGFDYEDNCKSQIDKFTKEIKRDNLIDKCSDDNKYFARQLCKCNGIECNKGHANMPTGSLDIKQF